MSTSLLIPPLIGSNFITWHHNGCQFSISSQDARFARVRDFLKARNYGAALLEFDRTAAIAKYTSGKVQVYGDSITYNGEMINGTIVDRILAFVEQGLPFEPLVAFLNNLYLNTDKEIREALYDFIEWNGLSITEDGAMVAYKLTTDEGTPYYHKTGTQYIYEVGKTYEMPKCDTVKARAECSSLGLYVGSRTYWNGKFDEKDNYTGDGKMFVVKVFPQHVISVPTSSSKCCVYKFEIIEEYKKVINEMKKPLYGHDSEKCCGGDCGNEDCLEGNEFIDKPMYDYPEFAPNKALRDAFGRFKSNNANIRRAKPKRDINGRFIRVSKSKKLNKKNNVRNKSRKS